MSLCPPVRFSIIVVTYKRDRRLAETLGRLLAVVRGRNDHELVLVDNNADGLCRDWAVEGFSDARILRPDRNLGVAGGRNLGISAARGEILFFLDDDALVATEDLLDRIDHLMASDSRIGVLAFRSVMAATGVIDPKEFPHSDKSRDPDSAFETFRFIGVAHAIRAESLREVGPYRPEFFYGMEEFELSYRLMKRGWRIRYEPSLSVIHLKDSDGRLPSTRTFEFAFLNKLRIAWMHLPAHLALLSALAWAANAVRLSRGRANLAKAILDFARWVQGHPGLRSPMSPALVRSIRQMGGQPWK